ncbi:MAG: RimK family alpha-L-glutamate ligase [Desulfobacteraceae bacterium]|jgi:ribosomal protein S6--L-glutamate ligase|nr:MAG: RimK family alpha-L-glutamate ligase [Desulfobacteraceae bacterium]
MKQYSEGFVALGARLKGIPEVVTLGVRPNFFDYDQGERLLIMEARIILFPTVNYSQFFTTMGKRIFPSLETHLYADEKIKQTTLFQLLGIPHPRTKIYYRRHKHQILNDFQFPFIAKIPRNSGRGSGVFLIKNHDELDRYLRISGIAYIQEYLPHDRDLRVVMINYDPILAYWRCVAQGDFRANLARGAAIDFRDIPEAALELARHTAVKCRFDDVGLDLLWCYNQWFVIEANMKYGRRGLQARGLSIKEIMRRKLLSGELMDCGDV